MTILPKKKQNKEKNENDNNEGSQSPSGAEGTSGRGGLARVRPNSPGGPQRWASPPPIDHEASGRFEDCTSSHGGVANNKRRIRDRSSPHRTVRKQRHETSSRAAASTQSLVSQASSAGAPTRGGGNRQQMSCAPSDSRLVASTSLTSQVNSEEERNDGFNSEDECGRPYDEGLVEKEKDFEMMLKEKRGFVIKRMEEDGACLFRAVADQVYGDQDMHSVVRLNCVDYMSKNVDFFKQFVTEDFNEYLNRKRSTSCHGNHIEMQALCELYNRPIEVYQLGINPINTFHASYKTDNDPIRVSYHNNVHYNSVVDPYKATVGVGLGLPGYQPGLADRNLVRDAVRQSEDCQIEQTMLEDKLRETDWELTQETIEEQVARESYLQWLRDQEKLGKSKASPRSATCSTATDNHQHHLWWEVPTNEAPKTPRNKSDQSSPKQLEGGQSPKSPLYQCTSSTVPHGASASKPVHSFNPEVGAVGGGFRETTSLMNELPPQLFGLSDWDDDTGMLAQAIAESQQQYLNELKLAARSGSPKSPGEPSPLEGKGKSLMPKDGYRPG